MKYRFYAVIVVSGMFFLLLSLTQAMPQSSKANVTIPANQEFVLGEYQNSAFKAKLNNTSDQDIEVSIVDKVSNERKDSFELASKTEISVNISKDEKVNLRNSNDKEVTIKVKLNKTVQGMRYQKAGAYE